MFLTCFIMEYEHKCCIITVKYFDVLKQVSCTLKTTFIVCHPLYFVPQMTFFNWSFVFQTDSKIEDLMNMLECPVCLDTADRPPIYQCPEGHLLCENCNQRLSTCPQCGHSLLNSRNRTAEGLAVKLQVRFCFT